MNASRRSAVRKRATVFLAASAIACSGRGPATAAKSPTEPAPQAVEAPPPFAEPRDDGRLPPSVRPVEYGLELELSPEDAHFSGRVRIGVRVESRTTAIVLHGRRLRVRDAQVTAAGVEQRAKVSFRAARGSKGEEDELVLATPRPIPPGDAEITIDYDADFSEGLNGLYRVVEGGRSYVFTQFEPVGARLAFPCFDEPDAKVPFEVSVTVPKDLVALSNMPVARRTEIGGGRARIDFEKSPPLPTYLVALAVGPLELREGKGSRVPLRLATVAGRSDLGELALSIAGEQLAVLEAYFGTPYPYPKLDLVAVPNFASGAMENAGLVTFREERLLVDPVTSPTAHRRALANTMAHELAHMWFGDLVTMRWWDDIWLNEGFATWMATRTLDQWRPEMRAGVDALGSTAFALDTDTLASSRIVRQPVRTTTEALEAFDGITYVKGASLLGMVERWVGADAFRRGVVDYLAVHRLGNATSDDLFDALSRASGQDVTGVLRSFTEQTGVPSVRVEPCRPEGGRPTIRLVPGEYRPLGAEVKGPAKKWRFPVCVHHGGLDSDAQACVLSLEGPASIALSTDVCPAFVHPNADQAGYYRAIVGADALLELAALPPGKLTARERVGLLSDGWAAVAAGTLDVRDYVELARRFRYDPDPVAWEQITRALEALDDDVVSEQDRPAFAAVVRDLLAPEAASLGFTQRPADGDAERMKRRAVLTTLGAVGRDPKVLREARTVTEKWLAAPTSVDGDRAAVALPLAARSGDLGMFERLVAILRSNPAPSDRVLAVTALGQFGAESLVVRALGLVLDGTVRSQDQAYLLRGLFGRAETRGAAFVFVAEHLDPFLASVPPFARRRIVPLVAAACSPEEIERAEATLAPKLATIEGADRGFAQALEQGARCAARRAHHGPRMSEWLGKQTGPGARAATKNAKN